MNLRNAVKRVVEHGLVASGVAAIARRRVTGCSLVLSYHNVIPDDVPIGGDAPNHLKVSEFAAQLDVLRATHTVVSLEELLTIGPGRYVARPPVAITFDDAYRGAVLLGLAEVIKRDMPATIFVAPGLLGGQTFWWDELASPEHGLSPALRAHALSSLAGDGNAVRSWALDHGHRRFPVMSSYYETCTEEELRVAVSYPRVTLGSHTWSHPELTRLSAAELIDELKRPREWLRAFTPNYIDAIAYPYGAFNEQVADAAAACGYVGGFAVAGGWRRHIGANADSNAYAWPRFNVPSGISVRGFSLRASGLLT
ncbi:polysaccharide deacetylase family protein [Gemmatimonas sp.]|uniref:polysaccharide deacetylase family protein n=1 Tax=Gemmatimonas sp. TaxID=1962908 RepID=UPI003F6FD744